MPFDAKSSKTEFKRCIIDPLYSDLEDPCQNLRELLQSVLLRRTSQSQSKLTATYESILLNLSTAERQHYTNILDMSKDDMDLLVNGTTGTKIYTKIFTTILRLRMFCNLGQFHDRVGSSPSWPKVTSTRSPVESDLGSELGCDVCQREESRDLLKHRMFCPDCSRLLESNQTISSEYSPAYLHATSEVSQTSSQADSAQSLFDQLSCKPYGSGLMSEHIGEAYPTKLLAVAEKLRQSDKGSKRFV